MSNQTHRILILHAAQGSKTEALCQQALAAAKPVYTLPSPHNAHLFALGAQPLPPDDPSALLATRTAPCSPRTISQPRAGSPAITVNLLNPPKSQFRQTHAAKSLDIVLFSKTHPIP